jgi:hypothetical protein
VAEQTNFPSEVAEAALAHTIPNKVEAAYKRTDFVEKRRKLMDAWASYCGSGNENIVALKVVREGHRSLGVRTLPELPQYARFPQDYFCGQQIFRVSGTSCGPFSDSYTSYPQSVLFFPRLMWGRIVQ